MTELAPVAIANRTGVHDLCFTFTQATVDPLWVLDTVQLVRLADAAGGAHPATIAVDR